jgi:hypothetical protein
MRRDANTTLKDLPGNAAILSTGSFYKGSDVLSVHGQYKHRKSVSWNVL